jgi:hypothetical protein
MNIKGILNWFKNLRKSTEEEVQALGRIIISSKNSSKTRRSTSGDRRKNKLYLYDASMPNLVEDQDVPINTVLNLRAIGDQGGGYDLGTIQQQAMALKQTVAEMLKYLTQFTPRQVKSWSTVQALALMPRAGKDANAYYDRTSLQFFYFPDNVRKRNIFTCDSKGIVSHEFGHAYLDILRPDWWDTQATEVWAFHEAFGDIIALLSSLQNDKLIDFAIAEINEDLSKSNVLTRLAGDLGIGLYNIFKDENSNKNCLRDLTQRFNYKLPEELPSNGNDDILTNESHSFARVFTGAFYEALCKVAIENNKKGMTLRDSMKIARDVMCRYIISAVCAVPTTTRLYDAVAKQIIQEDIKEGGTYQLALRSTFVSRKIISQDVMMLENIDLNSFISKLNVPYEIQNQGNNKIVRTVSKKTIKLTDKFDVVALNDNPLLGLEISVPDENAYYFNDQDKLYDVVATNENEVIDSAFACLTYLHENNLVGVHDEATFESKNGKLVRKKISCRCNKPNYCDPNAPEYGKPWKPKNNAGCVGCKGNCEPMSCECESPTPAATPKQGCFTRLVTGTTSTYKTGSRASRKVC